MTRRAVIVGINDYAKDDFTNLRFSVSDAQQVRDFLKGLPGEERFDCRFLENPSDNEVVDALDKALDDLRPGDQFVFYFSGHGYVRNGEDYLLLCKNARWSALNSGATNGTILCTHLAELVRKSSADSLLCFDSCRSALLAGGRDAAVEMQGGEVLTNLFARDINPSARRGRIWEIHSCSDGQRSFEKDKGKGKGYGVFTHAFLEYLKQRKTAGQAGVIDQELIAAVSEITSNESKQNQDPQLTSPGDASFTLFNAVETTITVERKLSPARVAAVVVLLIILAAIAICRSQGTSSNVDRQMAPSPTITTPEPEPRVNPSPGPGSQIQQQQIQIQKQQ